MTGGAGFIAYHLVDKLLLKDYQVTMLDNISSGFLENLQSHSFDFRESRPE